MPEKNACPDVRVEPPVDVHQRGILHDAIGQQTIGIGIVGSKTSLYAKIEIMALAQF